MLKIINPNFFNKIQLSYLFKLSSYQFSSNKQDKRYQALKQIKKKQKIEELNRKINTTSDNHNSVIAYGKFIRYQAIALFIAAVGIIIGYKFYESFENYRNPITKKKYFAILNAKKQQILQKVLEKQLSQQFKQISDSIYKMKAESIKQKLAHKLKNNNLVMKIFTNQSHIFSFIHNTIFISEKVLDSLNEEEIYFLALLYYSRKQLKMFTTKIPSSKIPSLLFMDNNYAFSIQEAIQYRSLYFSKISEKQFSVCMKYIQTILQEKVINNREMIKQIIHKLGNDDYKISMRNILSEITY